MRCTFILIGALAASLAPWAAWAGEKPKFTDEFPLAGCVFSSEGGNPYFILTPGRQLRFDNRRCVDAGQCDELEELTITVLDEEREVTLPIDGEMEVVTTRVVEEMETIDGEFAERSLNFFAECEGTGDVYYFGEEVFVPDEQGNPVGGADGPGAWLAGTNGAQPGVIMPGGAFLLGARYFQEIAPEVAMDRAEHVDMGLDMEVPAGNFSDCVQVVETTPLEKKKQSSTKIYCPGTGLVFDDGVELIGVVE